MPRRLGIIEAQLDVRGTSQNGAPRRTRRSPRLSSRVAARKSAARYAAMGGEAARVPTHRCRAGYRLPVDRLRPGGKMGEADACWRTTPSFPSQGYRGPCTNFFGCLRACLAAGSRRPAGGTTVRVAYSALLTLPHVRIPPMSSIVTGCLTSAESGRDKVGSGISTTRTVVPPAGRRDPAAKERARSSRRS